MYSIETGAPLSGARLLEIQAFLAQRGLTMEGAADFYVPLREDDGTIVATGSHEGRVLKYIAVSPAAEGTGAAATVVSELVSYAWREGIGHLFLYTKPENERMFRSLGFYPVAHTESVLMMEDRKDGIGKFLAAIPRKKDAKTVGACVMNCNPFTNGHRYLVETAAAACDLLYLFVVSEDASAFPAKVRFELVRRGTADLQNVIVTESRDYLVSRATFPTYFIKDRASTAHVQTDLDIAIFTERIAPALCITRRFVGTEPFCPVTRAYNERMKQLLPACGIELIEIERKDGISASKVRALMEQGDLAGIRKLVPDATYEYIKDHIG